MTLKTGLEAYWKLDEDSDGSGSVTRVDSHGSNNLTDVNTTPSGTGILGNGADFESGNSEYLTINDSVSLSTGDIDFTWAGWVKIESKPGTLMHIAGKGGTDQWEWELEWNNTVDRFRFYILTLAGVQKGIVDADDLGAPSLATWYYIVVWHDATANKVYIQVNNGTVDETATTGVSADGTGTFRIGYRSDNGFPLDAIVDESGFWKKVLTAGERGQLYNAGNGRSYDSFEPSFAGSITNTGALVRDTRKIIAGSITNTGALAAAALFFQTLAGSITNSGTLSTATTFVRALAGSITNTGSLGRTTLKVLAGSITNTGALTTVKAVLQKFYTWTTSFRASDREDPYHAGSDEKRGRA